jgi:hypothetical protein
MLPAPRYIDVLHRVTFAAGWESHRSQILRRLVLEDAADTNSTRTSPHYRHGWVPLRKGTQRDMSAGYSIGKIKIPHSGNMRHRLWTST